LRWKEENKKKKQHMWLSYKRKEKDQYILYGKRHRNIAAYRAYPQEAQY